jgi:hypothetical protein
MDHREPIAQCIRCQNRHRLFRKEGHREACHTISANQFLANDDGVDFRDGNLLDVCTVRAGISGVDEPYGSAALAVVGWFGNSVRSGTLGRWIRDRGVGLSVGTGALPADSAPKNPPPQMWMVATPPAEA